MSPTSQGQGLALVPECPICGGAERYYRFVVGDERFDQCRHCGLLSHKSRSGADGDPSYGLPEDGAPDAVLATRVVALLQRYAGGAVRRVGVVGSWPAAAAAVTRERGLEVVPLEPTASGAGLFDAVLVIHRLEDVVRPLELLVGVRGHLRRDGVVVVVSRQLARPDVRGPLMEGRQRHSFSDANLQTLFWRADFRAVLLDHDPGDELRTRRPLRLDAIAIGTLRPRREVPLLSVVVPVFNEAATVRTVLDTLAVKSIPGVDLEIIVVESASTDGSREIVREYAGRPRFRVVLEERPRGKGCAVRTGFRHAAGDVLLIQDADLEYDFLDYEMLVAPVLSGRAPFVLGTRHSGTWKIRKFAKGPIANVLNLAHWGLVFLMNRLYGQAMSDPFTMFKVFRADCLAGLAFECDRFDFDVELVCKLLRKGYVPLEIPVNYQSRSFEEGKKVRFFRDPPAWVAAMWRYRKLAVDVRSAALAAVQPSAATGGEMREGTDSTESPSARGSAERSR